MIKIKNKKQIKFLNNQKLIMLKKDTHLMKYTIIKTYFNNIKKT